MKRKCDHCDSEATVHEVTIHQGQKVEKHLCEHCARDEGIVVQSDAPIGELLTKFVISQGSGSSTKTRKQAPSCPDCGMVFDEFRKSGLLGCSACYETFADQLTPLLERAHDGGATHVGKVPRRAGASIDRQQLIAALRRQLDEAIESEQYERAAQLRDKILHAETTRRAEESHENDG